jgi:hypothetical protein
MPGPAVITRSPVATIAAMGALALADQRFAPVAGSSACSVVPEPTKTTPCATTGGALAAIGTDHVVSPLSQSSAASASPKGMKM